MHLFSTVVGCTQNTVMQYVSFGLHLFSKKLVNDQYARVQFPDRFVRERMSDMIASYKADEFSRPYNGLKGVFGFLDGSKIETQHSNREEVQKKHYLAWLHKSCINNLFAFLPDGTIFFYFVNWPGKS
jgi:hypothetical protein